MRMKNNFGVIINIFLLSISFSQAPCILGEVYVSEAANRGDPDDYIEVYIVEAKNVLWQVFN